MFTMSCYTLILAKRPRWQISVIFIFTLKYYLIFSYYLVATYSTFLKSTHNLKLLWDVALYGLTAPPALPARTQKPLGIIAEHGDRILRVFKTSSFVKNHESDQAGVYETQFGKDTMQPNT